MANPKDHEKADKRDATGSAKTGTSQHDLALKAMALKQAGDAGQSPMVEPGTPLHPKDSDASDGKADLAATGRRTAPSGAFDHAGETPARERSQTR